MNNAGTNGRVRVSAPDPDRPYIIALADEVPEIRQVLDANHVRYWVDEHTISVNGEPPFTFINLRQGTDALAVQKMLNDK